MDQGAQLRLYMRMRVAPLYATRLMVLGLLPCPTSHHPHRRHRPVCLHLPSQCSRCTSPGSPEGLARLLGGAPLKQLPRRCVINAPKPAPATLLRAPPSLMAALSLARYSHPTPTPTCAHCTPAPAALRPGSYSGGGGLLEGGTSGAMGAGGTGQLPQEASRAGSAGLGGAGTGRTTHRGEEEGRRAALRCHGPGPGPQLLLLLLTPCVGIYLGAGTLALVPAGVLVLTRAGSTFGCSIYCKWLVIDAD